METIIGKGLHTADGLIIDSIGSKVIYIKIMNILNQHKFGYYPQTIMVFMK